MVSRLSVISLVGGVLFLLITSTGVFQPALAEVIIDGTRTATVKLDELSPQAGKAYVTSTGHIKIPNIPFPTTYDTCGIFSSTGGWELRVAEVGVVRTDHPVGTGVFLRSAFLENQGEITSGGAYGAYFSGTGNTVINSGIIRNVSNPSNYGGIGIHIDNGTLNNTDKGTISTDKGIAAVRLNTGSVINSGTIEGKNFFGVYITDNGTLENTGTIYGKEIGVLVQGDIQNYADITNKGKGIISGDIQSGVSTAYANIHNLGADARITSTGLNGVYIDKAGTVENEGLITGSAGVYCAGNCNIINSGTIEGTGGTAVYMGKGDGTAIFRSGSNVSGEVNGGSGTDLLAFDDAGDQHADQYVHFENLAFIGGTTTLNGNWDFSGGDTMVTGNGTLMDLDTKATLKTAGLGIGDGGVANIAGKATVSDLTLVDKGGSLNVNRTGTMNTANLKINAGGNVNANGDLIVSTEVYNEGTVLNSTNKRLEIFWIKLPFGGGFFVKIPLPVYALQVTGDGTVTNKGSITGYSGILFGGGNNILDNYGTITGTNGIAVDMGAGDDTAIVRSGSLFNGVVDGGEGWDTAVFEKSISGISQYKNFENFSFLKGTTLRSAAFLNIDSYGKVYHLSGNNDFYDGRMTVDDDVLVILDGGATLKAGGFLINAGGGFDIDGAARMKTNSTVLGTLNVNQTGSLDSATLGIGGGGVANIAGKATVSDTTLVDKGGSLNVNQTGDLTGNKLQVNNTGIANIDGAAKVTADSTVFGILNVNQTGSLDSATLGIGGGGVANIAGKATVSDTTLVDKGGSLNVNQTGDLTGNKLQVNNTGIANIDGAAKVTADSTVFGILNVNQTGSLDSATLGIGGGGVANIAGKATVSDTTLVDKGGSLNVNKDGTFHTANLTVNTNGTVNANGDLIVSTGVNNNQGTITGTTLGGYAFQVTGTGNVLNTGTISGYSGILFGGGNNILDNSGTITGTNGIAVDMGGGDDAVILRSGSNITGNLDGNKGMDTIRLEDTGSITGGTVLNFETTRKTGSGTWTIDGDLKSGKYIYLDDGNLKVTGKYTQEKDSTFHVTFINGDAGKISARTAQIDGGIVIAEGYIREGSHVLIETEKGGLTGKFDELKPGEESQLGLYLKYKLVYTDDSASISGDVRRSRFFIEDALTRNEWAVASHLDGIYNNSSGDMTTVFDELMKSSSAAAARSALDQMGGTSHTAYTVIDTYRTASFYRNLFRRPSSLTSNAMEGRGTPLTMLAANIETLTDGGVSYITKDRKKDPFNLWIKGYGTTGDRDGDDIASRYDFTVGGTMGGMDFHLTHTIRAGFALGYARTGMNMKDLRDKGNEDSYQGAIYGSYTPQSNRWYMDLAFGYSKNSYETKRYIDFGAISRVATGSYYGRDISGYVEGGYRIPTVAGFAVTPYVTFLALQNHRDAFTEKGADALNLDADSENTLSLQGSLGARVARQFCVNKAVLLTPEVSARWIHEFGDDEAMLNARFAGTPSGSFTVYSDRFDRDSGVFSLGVTGKVKDAWSFFLAYDAQLRSKESVHAVTGGARLRW